MPRPHTLLTDEDKGKILAFLEDMSAEQVAHKMNRDPTTIRRFIAKYQNTGKIENLPRSGRPTILNNQEKETLLQKATEERRKPLHEIVSDLGLNCSLATAGRALHDSGIRSYIAAKKPFVSENHAKARIVWCEKNQNQHPYYWREVIFSDETSVEIGKQSRQVKVWRQTGERYNTECLTPSFKSGRQSVMAWGCFIGENKGPLVFCDEYKEKKEKITVKTYLKILEANLTPFYSALQPIAGRNLVFQHDNAPIHTAQKVTKWFKKKNITIMDWPASSPDLNPIENVWKLMKDNIQKRENFPRTVNELKTALKEEWSNFDTSLLRKVVDSMPRRIEAVLEAKGGPTKY
jgi:transposase